MIARRPFNPPPQPKPVKSRATIDIVQALNDKNLLGAALGDPTTWARWISVLKGLCVTHVALGP